MSTISNLSPKQLRKAARLQEKIGKLQTKLAAILGEKAKAVSPVARATKKKRVMSAAAKARISAAAKARWAKVKATGKKAL